MSNDSIYDIINQTEICIEQGFPLVAGYSIFKKSELHNSFKTIYENLPSELIENKEYIMQNKESNVFVQLNKVNSLLMQAKVFCGMIVLSKSVLYNIIDNIYIELPDDIMLSKRK